MRYAPQRALATDSLDLRMVESKKWDNRQDVIVGSVLASASRSNEVIPKPGPMARTGTVFLSRWWAGRGRLSFSLAAHHLPRGHEEADTKQL